MYWTLTLKIILVCVLLPFLVVFLVLILLILPINLLEKITNGGLIKEKEVKNGVYEGIKIFYGKFLWKLDKMES